LARSYPALPQELDVNRIHIAIRRESYVAGGRERPEVGIFTQTHATRPPVPWNRIAVGDTVYMKWSRGPIVARATVQGFRQMRRVDAECLRNATQGTRLYDLALYWESLPPVFNAVVVYLENEVWLDEPVVPANRSYGESWLVFNDDAAFDAWIDQPSSNQTPLRSRPPGRSPRTIPPSLRFAVFRRDAFTCRYCGRRAPFVTLVVDHIKPWSAGGPTSFDNLATACMECNAGKGPRPLAC
jgi:hypothetical protein